MNPWTDVVSKIPPSKQEIMYFYILHTRQIKGLLCNVALMCGKYTGH